MKYIIIIAFIILSPCLHAQVYFSVGDTVYNWAFNSINLHESSDIESEIVITIPFGEVVIIDSLEHNPEFRIEFIKPFETNGLKSKSYNLNTKTVKVKYKNKVGYVANCYLSRLKPFKKQHYVANINDEFKDHYGILRKFEFGNIGIEHFEIIYNNGFVFNRYLFNAGFEHTYFLPNVTFQEGILIFYDAIQGKNQTDINERLMIKNVENNFVEFYDSTDMYFASIRKESNIIIITMNGYN